MIPNNIVRVVLWMVGTLLSFCVMAVSVRELSLHGLNTFEILAVRSGIGLLILLGLLLVRPSLRSHVRARRMPLHLLRNSVHYAGQYLWAIGLTVLPFATVFALEFTMPAWTVLLAPWLLRERLTPSRVGVVVLGLVGVLVILRPGVETVNHGAFLVLVAAVFYSLTMITTKQLTATETTLSIVFWMSVIQLPLSMLGSDPMIFTRLGTSALLPVLGLGIGGLSSHYCLSNAFRAGDATLVVPLDFMRIPLIAVVGWAFYGERLDIFVLIGAVVIVTGVIWNLRSEAARAL